VVVMIHRPRKKKGDDQDDLPVGGRETILIVGKQRNGPTGDVPVVFLKPYARFEDKAPETSDDFGEPERLPYND